MNRYSDDSSSDDETILLQSSKTQKDPKLWDSFQDPPAPQTGGSAVDLKRFNTCKKVFKLLVYIVTFLIILASGILSKLTVFLMASHIKPDTKVEFCNIQYPNSTQYAIIPKEQNIAWIWALVFAFSVPEVGAFLRAARICFFRKLRKATWTELGIVWFFETLHVIGLGVFIFQILPDLDVIKGVTLTSSMSFIPAIFNLICRSSYEKNTFLFYILDVFSIGAQLTGLIVWPIMLKQTELWLISFAVILISCRWWENYISSHSPISFLRNVNKFKTNLMEPRYGMYLIICPWKIILFTLIGIAITGFPVEEYFTLFLKGWQDHRIAIEQTLDVFNEQSPDQRIIFGHTTSSHYYILWMFLVQAISSWLLYVSAKFSCKIQIQPFSFALPINLTVPVTVIVLITFCILRETNVCIFHYFLPDYLFFHSPPVYEVIEYITKEHCWAWILWLFSQAWITKHLWNPKNDRNASTEKLFVIPMYSGLIVDQCTAMNRRRDDREHYVQNADISAEDDPEMFATNYIDKKAQLQIKEDVQASDHIPQIYICATMWHETEDEMMEFLKSILRLDEDQCARRMAMKYIDASHDHVDNEYYDLETHIFFDDAFVNNKTTIKMDTSPLNDYIKLLIVNIEKAAGEVYKTNIRISPPTKIVTPYGGRLIWTLPGRTKMVAHLKDTNKIRRKKRWSQVMYMYYLLGYRIMQMNASPERKLAISSNTFLLALDGDIDFQPEAVRLLIGRMKVDPDLGAACGRIHPVGGGPMVWYQVFEYAIGHWLQKATEHVIGCVLCSPGCFSLFRGRALMENSVMKKYTTKSTQARHYVQYDQGEDRWLCTLLLKQKFRVEYSAASDAYTHAPEGFNEFYNQRRRWIPSTMCNIMDLLGDAKTIVNKNNSISMPYIFYQGMLMVGTILGPGTIFLMMVGALVAVFNISIWTSFLWNFFPLLGFMIICYFCAQKYQLMAAFVISAVYSLVMMAVLVGIIMQVLDDGIFSPSSMFFFVVAGQVVITGLMHPQEVTALIFGIVYYITIPSMYMMLVVYSLFNLNDVSWGTRENPQDAEDENPSVKVENQAKQGRMQKLIDMLKSEKKEEEGSFDFSINGLFRCVMCTRPKTNTEQMHLIHISDQISELNNKLKQLDLKISGEEIAMQEDENGISIHDTDDEEMTPLQEPEVKKNQTKIAAILPDWLYDKVLKNSKTDTLPEKEEDFWDDLIGKYLKPLDKNEEEEKKNAKALKELRDIAVFAFVMLNALFVLIVFLLQLNKETLHIQWPYSAKSFIEYEPSTREITIRRDYLELEPIGLLFVIFFGIILFIQFLAMMVHRFATISQILATTQLDWYFGRKPDGMSADAELKGASVDIAKILQKPQPQWDENDMTAEQQKIERRGTIHRILYQHKNKQDYSNLETNFKRKYFNEGDLDINLNRVSVSRKTIALLDNRRKSMVEQRKLRKSQLIQHNQSPSVRFSNHHNSQNTAQWINQVDNVAGGDSYPNYYDNGIDNVAFEPVPNDDIQINNRRPRQSKVTYAA